MPGEEFVIKITAKGEVWVDLRGLGQMRVREIREMLEEIVGPAIQQLSLADDAPGPAVRIVTEEGEERHELKGS